MDNGVTTMQVDLQQPMIIDSIVKDGQLYNFTREGNVYWVKLRNDTDRDKIKPGKEALTI